MIKKSKEIFLRSFVALLFIGLLALPHFMSPNDLDFSGNNSVDTLEALRVNGFYLKEVSEESGVKFVHHSPDLDPVIHPILPQIASMGASVSVSDYDNDGWNDLYVTNSKFGYENALYHNEKDGTFSNVADQLGIAKLNTRELGVSMGSVWADYDNDGYEDLFVYRWGRPELFRNDQGKAFINVTEKAGLPAWINANSAIWLDFNSDGHTDLFIGGYFREDIDLWNLKTTRILPESFEYAQNGGRNYLLQNNGDGSFSDITYKVGLNSTRWTLAAGSADMNNDGFPELIVANDFGVDEIYFNDNGTGFTEKGNRSMIGFSPKSGMNVSFGDVLNKGEFGIYISNITEDGILMQGNNFWMPSKTKGKDLYENMATRFGIESGGWSYCAQFGDLNNDGFTDLYVANGYISARKGTNYWYDYAKVTGGNSNIISDIKNWPAMEGRSHSGYQQNRIWLNQNTDFFIDVAEKVNGKELFDSRAVALVDLWNRGVLDIVVANQNNKLQIYKNHVDINNNWIAFELKGTRSNRTAINAMVEIHWDGHIQSQIVTGGIGFCSQNQRRLHFGLGKNAVVDHVIITWPGGKKQIIQRPDINKIHEILEI